MKAITKLTAGQAQMLKNIMCNEHQPLNGKIPEQFSEIQEIWTSEVVRNLSDKGTLTSLINAGLVVHWGRGADSCVRMTQEGWDAIVNY
jgi:hypothetical protein